MNLLQDVKFALRMLVKDRWFTVVAALTLALGIGATNAAFTMVNAVFFRSMPFVDPDRVVLVGTRDNRGRDRGASYLDFKDWQESARAFTGMAALAGGTMNASDEGRAPERFTGAYVSADTFRLMGEKPSRGRDLLAEDDRPGAEAIVLLGSAMWKSRYGGDPASIGRTIDAASATSLLRDEMRALDPDLPLFNIQTMDDWLALQRWPFRVFGSMFAIFACIALVLSAVGLYAVTAYSVSQRTQEIGIRMALCAQSAQVRWLILRQGLAKLAIGLPLGLAGSLGVGVLLKTLLVQTGTRDPVTLFSVVALLAVVSVFACIWPARRATRLDPMVALRHE